MAYIYSGAASSDLYHLKVYNTKLYFGANDGRTVMKYKSYDGVNPPRMVADTITNAGSFDPSDFFVCKSKLYFMGRDDLTDLELGGIISGPSLGQCF